MQFALDLLHVFTGDAQNGAFMRWAGDDQKRSSALCRERACLLQQACGDALQRSSHYQYRRKTIEAPTAIGGIQRAVSGIEAKRIKKHALC